MGLLGGGVGGFLETECKRCLHALSHKYRKVNQLPFFSLFSPQGEGGSDSPGGGGSISAALHQASFFDVAITAHQG